MFHFQLHYEFDGMMCTTTSVIVLQIFGQSGLLSDSRNLPIASFLFILGPVRRKIMALRPSLYVPWSSMLIK